MFLFLHKMVNAQIQVKSSMYVRLLALFHKSCADLQANFNHICLDIHVYKYDIGTR